ncbi:hypothetical protein POM88_026957 [Heracleum sosnowskyi]|uniref:CASP-like protein n=1 Tax=Heracleum sosnowskyi TaxID=360622 RepID=A0AAD8I7J3_9APIA|nr:hypothetical protein POM88_026957 [Heracleum sosnowskyi]
MAMMVRPAVAERNYYVPRVQSSPPAPLLQSQALAVADNIYVPVQSLPPPQPMGLEYPDNAVKPSRNANYYYAVAEVVLRVLYFVFSLAALLILLTSKQTIVYWISGISVPPQQVTSTATFTKYSPTFRYFMVAVAASSLYSLVTTILAFINLFNKGFSRSRDLLTQLITTMDVVMLGIVGSASGAASAVTYIGLRGNYNLDWDAICDSYDTFCFHIGFSVISSLLASLVLIILISFSVSSLTNRLASSYGELRSE